MKFTLVFTLFLVLMGAMMSSAADCSNCKYRTSNPMCGTDGNTYRNECALNCYNVTLAHEGEC